MACVGFDDRRSDVCTSVSVNILLGRSAADVGFRALRLMRVRDAL